MKKRIPIELTNLFRQHCRLNIWYIGCIDKYCICICQFNHYLQCLQIFRRQCFLKLFNIFLQSITFRHLGHLEDSRWCAPTCHVLSLDSASRTLSCGQKNPSGRSLSLVTLSRRSLSSGQQIPPRDCCQIQHEPASRIPLTGICRSWLHQPREVPCRLLDSHFGRRKLEQLPEEVPGSKNVPCLSTESAEFECTTDR